MNWLIMFICIAGTVLGILSVAAIGYLIAEFFRFLNKASKATARRELDAIVRKNKVKL